MVIYDYGLTSYSFTILTSDVYLTAPRLDRHGPRDRETPFLQGGQRNSTHGIFRINTAQLPSSLYSHPRAESHPFPVPVTSSATYPPPPTRRQYNHGLADTTRGTYLPWRILPPSLRMPLIQSPDQIPVSREARKQAWIRLLRRRDGGIDHTRRQQQPFLAVAVHVSRVHCAEDCVYWLVRLI